MQMPGGLWRQGERLREFAFRPVSGEVELAIIESKKHQAGLPQQVTSVLLTALEQLGGQPPMLEEVRQLAVGDRQFLMRRLLLELEIDKLWLKAPCNVCGELFDLQINISKLPVKEADDGFPFTSADTSIGRVELRLPSGVDQEWVALNNHRSEDHTIRELMRRCITMIDADNDTAPVAETFARFTADDLTAIEASLETAAPEITNEITTNCPDCNARNRVYIDPYYCLDMDGDLLDEIHTLAKTYHWSEEIILKLSSSRRRRYRDLIERELGMVQ